MYINQDGEYGMARTYTNGDGETVKQYKTYQENGWTRIVEEYPDGTITETFER